jgi:hypothetical protein
MTGFAKQISPRRFTWVLSVAFLVGLCSRGYGNYNQTLKSAPEVWTKVLAGTADAPEQYRVGVIFAADWMTRVLPLRLSQAFGILDLLGSVIAVLLLYELLRRSRAFQAASLPLQWFGSAAFLMLTFYLLDWSDWYQRVTTLPTACLVALMLWLWTPSPAHSKRLPHWLVAVGFFAIAVAQAFVRADIALVICLGVWIVSLARSSPHLSLPRGLAIFVSFVTAVAVAAVQIYLMRVRYAHATYGDTRVFMLAADFWRIPEWISFFIFVTPFLWTLAQAFRLRSTLGGANAAFLLAATGYVFLWITLGRLDEVRIFLPLAWALTPLTVELAMRNVAQNTAGPPGLGTVPFGDGA